MVEPLLVQGRMAVEGEGDCGRHAVAVTVAARLAVLAGCGSAATRAAAAPAPSTGTSSTSPAAAYDQAVADCNKQADGRYEINYVKLPTDANQQRELIVRRLAAEDDEHRPASAWT